MEPNPIRATALFINMGGPKRLGDVARFMFNLFNDPHIINLPQPLRSLIACSVCAGRLKSVRKNYQAIGGSSPIFCWTELQAKKTIGKLTARFPHLTYRLAYSYADPFIKSMIGELARDEPERIVVVPLYPYYSIATLGSMYSDIEQARRTYGLADKLKIVPPYYDDDLYIEGTVRLLRDALAKMDKTQSFRVIFTAHSLPVSSIIKKGDPYRQQVESTVPRILERVPLEHVVLAFQSKIGPVEWMGPSTIDTVRQTGRLGYKQVLVMPLGFTCDHIETLDELDIGLAQTAREAGIETFVRGPVFNDHDLFIELLAKYVTAGLS